MTTIAQKYRELLTLAQSHILDEYARTEWLLTDAETYMFYCQNVTKQCPTPHSLPKQLPTPRRDPTKATTPPSTASEVPLAPNSTHVPKRRDTFKREPLSTPNIPDLGPIKKIVQTHTPEINIIGETPDDSQAHKIGQRWKVAAQHPEVIILSFDEDPEGRSFLNNVSKAIDLCLAPTMIYSAQKVEQHQAWLQIFNAKDLKLIITADYGMSTLPSLKQHYRESPGKKQRYLGGIPVLLLTDLKLYMEKPTLKQALWNAVTVSLSTKESLF